MARSLEIGLGDMVMQSDRHLKFNGEIGGRARRRAVVFYIF